MKEDVQKLANLVGDLMKTVEDQQRFIDSLKFTDTIPLDVASAFKARAISQPINTSAKSSTSENQAVHEAGSANYDVLKPPDTFLQVFIGGTTYYIPVFT